MRANLASIRYIPWLRAALYVVHLERIIRWARVRLPHDSTRS